MGDDVLPLLSLADRVAATEETLADHCRLTGIPVTGDRRVTEQHAAQLLGLAPGSLAKMRGEGRAPASYRLGFAGARLSYRLRDIAAWIEDSREDF
ncbi:helix-turn-helix transcriptional regulator [Bosea sp. TAF32]|uniref:helix-turn-helix transcriptional regulator n=1 Tax=Bosea sp. TAF32 TaxID=3237482 RepID=UPI003F923E4C